MRDSVVQLAPLRGMNDEELARIESRRQREAELSVPESMSTTEEEEENQNLISEEQIRRMKGDLKCQCLFSISLAVCYTIRVFQLREVFVKVSETDKQLFWIVFANILLYYVEVMVQIS